jgi:uncharacterized membrane protein YjdF
MQILREFIGFLAHRKKYWLMPIILILFLFGLIIVTGQGSVLTPFIYTMF